MSQPSMDTLSTLREVNSNPPSPESSISVFPQLVISPPLCGDASDNVDPCTKPQNGLDPFPTNEAPSLETLRWSASVLFNITRLLTFNIIPYKIQSNPSTFWYIVLLFVFPELIPQSVVPPLSLAPRNFAGQLSLARIISHPNHGGVSSHFSSPGKPQRHRFAVCQVLRGWGGGGKAWLDSSPGDLLVQPQTLCSSLTPIMTSRE